MSIPTQEQLLIKLLSNISDEYDKTDGSFFFDMQKPLSIELESIYQLVSDRFNNSFARTAIGDALDAIASIHGLTRKEASYASGEVTIVGDVGAKILNGMKVASDELIFSYLGTDTVIGSSGSITISVECDSSGGSGNISVGAINHFPVTVSGLVSVINENKFTGGTDEETDEELRERILFVIRNSTGSGNKSDYERWALEVTGVYSVIVKPTEYGVGTVGIIILGENGSSIPELISSVKEYLDPTEYTGQGYGKAPIGARVTVVTANNFTVNITIPNLVLIDGYTENDVKKNIKTAITKTINTVNLSGVVRVQAVEASISSVDGVLDFGDTLLNDTHSNIQLSDGYKAVVGELRYE